MSHGAERVPNRTELNRTGPNRTGLGQTEPNRAEPNRAVPGLAAAPHQVEAELDGALQVPAGGGELLEVLEAEAEAGAADGADLAGAELHQEGHVLHLRARPLRVH